MGRCIEGVSQSLGHDMLTDSLQGISMTAPYYLVGSIIGLCGGVMDLQTGEDNSPVCTPLDFLICDGVFLISCIHGGNKAVIGCPGTFENTDTAGSVRVDTGGNQPG